MFICLVLVCIFGVLAISRDPLLSSNTLQCIFVDESELRNILSFNSFHKFAIGITSLIAIDMAIYSVSIVDNTICVCSLELQVIAHTMKVIVYPVLNFAVLISSSDVNLFQFPRNLHQLSTPMISLDLVSVLVHSLLFFLDSSLD